MAQQAQELSEGTSGVTSTVPPDRKSEALGFECLSGAPKLEIDVDLPEVMVDLVLDKELEDFLDRVMATGILIY